jgi:hypothetical protein
MECKSCGFELLAGSKFCSKCGEKQERVCFACSKPVGELANFCGYCGNQVSDDKFSEAKVGNLRNNENLSNANVGVRGDIQVQEDTYRLIDMSFVSVCASIGTLSHIAENEGVGAGRPSDIVRFIDKRLDELRSEMISNIKDLRWLNEKQILFMYSVDHNGSGLGSFMKEVDDRAIGS